MNSIQAIRESIAAQQREGERPLTVRIGPGLTEDALNLPGFRKLFAPVISGETDMGPIDAACEQMRQACEPVEVILVLVECGTIGEFREAVERLPVRTSSEWRCFSTPGSDSSRWD